MSDTEESTSSYFMTFKQFGTGKDFDIFQNNEYRVPTALKGVMRSITTTPTLNPLAVQKENSYAQIQKAIASPW